MTNLVRLSRLAVTLGLAFASSAPAQSYSKTEEIAYHDNTTIWVLGQTESVTCTAAFPPKSAM